MLGALLDLLVAKEVDVLIRERLIADIAVMGIMLDVHLLDLLCQYNLHNHTVAGTELLTGRQTLKLLIQCQMLHEVNTVIHRHTHTGTLNTISAVVHDIEVTVPSEVLLVGRLEVDNDAGISVTLHGIGYCIMIESHSSSTAKRADKVVLEDYGLILVYINVYQIGLNLRLYELRSLQEVQEALFVLAHDNTLASVSVLAVVFLGSTLLKADRQNHLARFRTVLGKFGRKIDLLEVLGIQCSSIHIVKRHCSANVPVKTGIISIMDIRTLTGSHNLLHQFNGRITLTDVFLFLCLDGNCLYILGIHRKLNVQDARLLYHYLNILIAESMKDKGSRTESDLVVTASIGKYLSVWLVLIPNLCLLHGLIIKCINNFTRNHLSKRRYGNSYHEQKECYLTFHIYII